MKEAIDNKELVIALEELEKEKGIKKEYVIESIETALVTAYKRNFDSAENVKADAPGSAFCETHKKQKRKHREWSKRNQPKTGAG